MNHSYNAKKALFEKDLFISSTEAHLLLIDM